MSSVVLDSSALVAYIKQEPGGTAIAEHVRGALLSSVNLAETIAILVRDGLSFEHARNAVELTEVLTVDFDGGLGQATAVLIGRTRHRGLSLADCACLALAARENLPALTADRGWRDLDVGVEVQFIR